MRFHHVVLNWVSAVDRAEAGPSLSISAAPLIRGKIAKEIVPTFLFLLGRVRLFGDEEIGRS